MKQNIEWTTAHQKEFERQMTIILNGVSEITPREDFESMLKKSILHNRPLRVKCGIDPTLSEIHLGHLIPYKKMRTFQDLGHLGVVIFGDYTAQIGDPTGKTESRVALSEEDVKKNVESFLEQIQTVIDPNKVEIHYQSEWFSKVTLKDILGWCMETTVAKLLSHETFSLRLEENRPLGLHELMYPVLQGMDSVFVNADIELGGTDQRFNVLMGRDYQKNRNMPLQVAILLPIIKGTCGQQKMSKSLNNFIGVRDTPKDKFGKVMRIPDTLLEEYYRYLLGWDKEQWSALEKDLAAQTQHPNTVKKDLAENVVRFFHGDQVAKNERLEFESIFAKGQKPADTPTILCKKGLMLLDVLALEKIIETKSEGRRLFTQNAVSILDSSLKLHDANMLVDENLDGQTIKLGKRKFVTIKLI